MAQVKERYDICSGEEYTTNSGEKKVTWHKVGEGTIFDDGNIVEKLFFGNQKFKWFKREKKQQEPQKNNENLPFD